MVPIQIAIRQIRHAVHDMDSLNYTDNEILDVLNSGLRMIRRSIASLQPELISSTTTGILAIGEDEIFLKRRPLQIIEVTAGDKVLSVIEGFTNKKIWHNRDKIFGNRTLIYSKYQIRRFEEYKLHETNLQHVFLRNQSGRVREFYRTGWQSLKLTPTPRNETAFTIRTVDDIIEMKMEDETPIPAEFDDFLIEYAVMRLSIDNEYDATQEQQITANIHQQISMLLAPPPASVLVRGYW